jgi:hypothetical protein
MYFDVKYNTMHMLNQTNLVKVLECQVLSVNCSGRAKGVASIWYALLHEMKRQLITCL